MTLNFKAKSKSEVRSHLLRECKNQHLLRSIQGQRVYFGLHDVTGREARYYTFLRHPVDIIECIYNFFIGKPERHEIIFPSGKLIPFHECIEIPMMRGVIARQLASSIEGENIPGMPLQMDT